MHPDPIGAQHFGGSPDVDALLSRLERVRRAGKGWTAKCPAHTDRSASLSVAVGDDGRILCHCFASCSVGDVLAAIGLSVSDLFPARIRDHSPDGRRELREAARQSQWRAALNALALEASIVAIAASDLIAGRLNGADLGRVIVAVDRIDAALAALTWRASR